MCVYTWVYTSQMQRSEDNSQGCILAWGSQEWPSGYQAWQQEPSPTEPFLWFRLVILTTFCVFSTGHSHQLFHVCVILATHLQMEAILLDKTLRKEWLLATSRPFSLPQIAAAMLLCIIFSLSNIIYFSAALNRIPEPELHEKETWFRTRQVSVLSHWCGAGLLWPKVFVVTDVLTLFNGLISKRASNPGRVLHTCTDSVKCSVKRRAWA